MKHFKQIDILQKPCEDCEKTGIAGFETKFKEHKANGKILRLCADCLKQLAVKTDLAKRNFKTKKNPYLGSTDGLT